MNKSMGQQVTPTKKYIQDRLFNNFIYLLNENNDSHFIDKDIGEKEFFKDDKTAYLEVMKIIDYFKVNNSASREITPQKFSDVVDFKISRAIACFVCSGIGDALGTHIEFENVQYERQPLIWGFNKDQYSEFNRKKQRCYLGEFSDDTSMSLCLADHLLFNDFNFDALDLQIKFINWWYFSYNNCLEPRRHSFGLGGNINSSMKMFLFKSRDILIDLMLTYS